MTRSIESYKVVAFDWDGTVVDSVPYKIAQNQALAREFGNPLTEEEVRIIWNEATGFPDLMKKLCLTDDMDAIMAVVKRDYHKREFAKRPFPFGKDVLEHLVKNGTSLALITNATEEILTADVPLSGLERLEDYFAFVQTADRFEFKKPDPRVFGPLLQTLDALPENVLYVGDELKDYVAANNAGIDFIGVETGMATAEEFEAAGTRSVRDISQLVTLN